MAMSAKERQEKRRKAIKGEHGRVLSVVQTVDERLALERLARYHGLTKAAMIARLISEEDGRIIHSLINVREDIDRYMDRDTSQGNG
ncbi:MAG: hypothetical protein ACYDAM_01995 [Leptospirales bacterium]